MSANIRIAHKSDLERIQEIYNQAVAFGLQTADTEPLSLQEVEEWFENHHVPDYPVYVLEHEQKIIGWSSLSAYRNGRRAVATAVEISYYIDAEYQGRGLGTFLLEAGLKDAKKLGFRKVFAIILESNTRSIQLVKKAGFELWGRLPKIAEFNGTWYDHLYYGLNISDILDP